MQQNNDPKHTRKSTFFSVTQKKPKTNKQKKNNLNEDFGEA